VHGHSQRRHLTVVDGTAARSSTEQSTTTAPALTLVRPAREAAPYPWGLAAATFLRETVAELQRRTPQA